LAKVPGEALAALGIPEIQVFLDKLKSVLFTKKPEIDSMGPSAPVARFLGCFWTLSITQNSQTIV
jgi:hypothetical protein